MYNQTIMIMKKQLILLVLMMLPMVVSAHDVEIKNADGVTIYYNYMNDSKDLQVTFRGPSYNSYSNEYTGSIVIPESVSFNNVSHRVKGIGNLAFDSCPDLTSITIPNSVTSIGNSAFLDCTGLKKVFISDIAAWCGISFGNYSANPLYIAGHLYSDENTEIQELVIPNSVTSIGNSAFYGCSGLTSITIPNSVTSIGEGAFSGCSGLTSITIPNSVTSIGEGAFSGCSGLTSITIPNSVTSIGYRAFMSCSGLTSITIPNSVTSIGEGAFYGCI